MIKQLPLFFEKNENRYYYVGYCKCDGCESLLKDTVIITHYWDKKNSSYSLNCLNCFYKRKETPHIVKEVRGARIVFDRPETAFPVIIQPPGLQSGRGDETVFSMAEKQRENEEVIDRTRLAGRESWSGAQIGKRPEDVESKDKALSAGEVEDLLLGALNATPALESKGKKRLENKKE